MKEKPPENFSPLRERIHEIIFEADTREGKRFDIALFSAIFLSVIVVMLETVPFLHEHYGQFFLTIEWLLTIFFTIEYFLRLFSSRRLLIDPSLLNEKPHLTSAYLFS